MSLLNRSSSFQPPSPGGSSLNSPSNLVNRSSIFEVQNLSNVEPFIQNGITVRGAKNSTFKERPGTNNTGLPLEVGSIVGKSIEATGFDWPAQLCLTNFPDFYDTNHPYVYYLQGTNPRKRYYNTLPADSGPIKVLDIQAFYAENYKAMDGTPYDPAINGRVNSVAYTAVTVNQDGVSQYSPSGTKLFLDATGSDGQPIPFWAGEDISIGIRRTDVYSTEVKGLIIGGFTSALLVSSTTPIYVTYHPINLKQ
jgi:hypothetical protein